jgi:hypothetical protein
MTTIAQVLRAPVAVAAVVLAVAPVTGALLGADYLRIWLGLPPIAAGVLRFVMLAYSVTVMAWTVAHSTVARPVQLLLRSLAGMVTLGGLTLVAAVAWASPSRSTDYQEWIVLFYCPTAAVVASVASTASLLGGRGGSREVKTSGLLGAAVALGLAGWLTYFILREALPQVARVALPTTVSAMVAGLFAACAWDASRPVLVRVPSGVAAGTIAILMAMA